MQAGGKVAGRAGKELVEAEKREKAAIREHEDKVC